MKTEARPLYDCLASFSGRPCPHIETFLYWSRADFGLKPVFSVTQVFLYRTTRAGQPWLFLALKQLYANHYLDSALSLAVLVQSGDAPNPALWILYVSRSRTDALGGWLGGLKRLIVEGRSRDAMQKNLAKLKQRLQLKYFFPQPDEWERNSPDR